MKYLSLFSGIGEAKKLYESGLSQKEVAHEMGTTQKIIWRALKNAGVKCRVAKKRNQFGKNNDSWKGNKAGYAAFHYRVEKQRGKPKKCSMCEATSPYMKYEWANITGRYERVYDYVRLCCSCHKRVDKIINNLHQ